MTYTYTAETLLFADDDELLWLLIAASPDCNLVVEQAVFSLEADADMAQIVEWSHDCRLLRTAALTRATAHLPLTWDKPQT